MPRSLVYRYGYDEQTGNSEIKLVVFLNSVIGEEIILYYNHCTLKICVIIDKEDGDDGDEEDEEDDFALYSTKNR